MTDFLIRDAVLACGGVLVGTCDPNALLRHMVIDSRMVKPGDIFVALRGEKADGHAYITSALDNGAACCLAEYCPHAETRGVILVSDPVKAMEQIASSYRSRQQIPVIGITGSVGKTSAKEMISSVLAQRFNVWKTQGNLNNRLGVPMTVSMIAPEHSAAVIEMGISEFGEMTCLANIVRPDIAVYTVIGHAHLEFLGNLDGVLRAKGEMIDYVSDQGTVIVNGDDPKLSSWIINRRKVTYGIGEHCNVRAEHINIEADRTYCEIVYGSRRISVCIPAFGKHMVSTALAGATVGFELGLTDKEIHDGITQYQTVGRRAHTVNTPWITVIDDCYNSNPDSLKNGIDSLQLLPGRHVCVLGDMRELGPDSLKLHSDIGLYARQQGIDCLLTSGKFSQHIAESFGDNAFHFETVEELVHALPAYIRTGDCVLVKASLMSNFAHVSDALKNLVLQS